MEEENNEIVGGVQEIVARYIPKYMALPIRGFRDPRYHCFVSTSQLARMSHNFSLIHDPMFLARRATRFLTRNMDSGVLQTSSDIFAFMYLTRALTPRLQYILSIQFTGLQKGYHNEGFTELKDNRIGQYTQQDGEQYSHSIISPWEYIIFNHPVHAVTDGEVIEVTNKYEDFVKPTSEITYKDSNVDKYLGNKIVVKYNNCFQMVYANIKKNSFTKKVGDKVKRGETICKVGLSGQFRNSFLFFALQSIGPTIPYVGNLRMTFPNLIQTWDTHYESLIYKTNNYYGEPISFEDMMTKFYSHEIKYQFGPSVLRDMSFVKAAPTIMVE